ncbi:MBL fold metallo-hydrolase [Delftia acidovorans]|uniref:MBL fold metallo-hydrolase n=1 Tax=Delftia acidovorans TaxID=80866 RepID=A0A7T2S2B4_DELAC|nr:MBL fold metallo-hydrolase [Delftia acidovorans]QPS07620.1 MBL fold metallo-hydrolase [Delftia acidovorans]
MTDRRMKLHTLGTGGPRLDAERSSSCHILETGGQYLIFDIGRGAIQRIAQKRLPIASLGPLFISHHHVDHIGEFANYLITSWIEGRRAPLCVYGPPGTAAIVDILMASVYDRDIAFRTQGEKAFGPFVGAQVIELRGGEVVEGDGWRVRCAEVEHGHKLPFSNVFRRGWICHAYRVECEGKVFSYSGDAVMCDALAGIAENADLHLQCCYMPRSAFTRSTHLQDVSRYTLACSDTAGKIAARAAVKQLVLTHFKRLSVEELLEIERDVRADFSGPVHLSHDLSEYDF